MSEGLWVQGLRRVIRVQDPMRLGTLEGLISHVVGFRL